MDISNSLVTTGFKSPLLTPANQADALSRGRGNLPVGTENPRNSQTKPDADNINRADFEKKAQTIESARVQRVNSLESAPFKNQQAVNAYQQTIEAARQFDEGELVGIDLFV